ncbi:hypothetical protein CFR76_00055 [Komagataeibacter swingsii]|uniref:Uncharacterized protein n=1 Tax=Komagataeibacter swingsii TaxID=215220 RepID=A0A2V4R298_9PROT|nr:hypothetical protein CFR76_00055 [Komagataeibacter swingsii]
MGFLMSWPMPDAGCRMPDAGRLRDGHASPGHGRMRAAGDALPPEGEGHIDGSGLNQGARASRRGQVMMRDICMFIMPRGVLFPPLWHSAWDGVNDT